MWYVMELYMIYIIKYILMIGKGRSLVQYIHIVKKLFLKSSLYSFIHQVVYIYMRIYYYNTYYTIYSLLTINVQILDVMIYNIILILCTDIALSPFFTSKAMFRYGLL